MLSLNAPINNDDPNEISIFIEDPKGEELMQQYIAKDTCEQIMTLLPPKEQEWIMELMRSSTAREFAAKKNIPEETCRVRSAKLISKIRELIINKSPIGQNPLMKRLLNKNNKYIYPKYQHNYYKHHRGKWVKNPRKIN